MLTTIIMIIGGVLLVIPIGIYVIAGKYNKELFEDLNEKEYKIKFLMPAGLYIANKIVAGHYGATRWDRKVYQNLKALYGKRDLSKQIRLFWADKMALILLCSALLGAITLLSVYKSGDMTDPNKGFLRPSFGESKDVHTVEAVISVPGKEIKKAFDVVVEPLKPTSEEMQAMLKSAGSYVVTKLFNEVKESGAYTVTEDLNLKEFANLSEDIKIDFISSDPTIINEDGEIVAENIPTEGLEVMVEAFLTATDGQQEKVELPLLVTPNNDPDYLMNNAVKEVSGKLKEIRESETGETAELPQELEKVSGASVKWRMPMNYQTLKIVVFGLVVIVLLLFLKDSEINKKAEERRDLIRYAFPGFVNQMVLLLGAGMNVQMAWERMTMDYIEKKEKSAKNKEQKKELFSFLNKEKSIDNPLYEEMIRTLMHMRGGMSTDEALSNFSDNCKTREVTQFISVISQNMRRGSGDLLTVLNAQSQEAWEVRKTTAKKIGEQMGTKLLFPLIFMLLGVIIIVVAPAFFSMRM